MRRSRPSSDGMLQTASSGVLASFEASTYYGTVRLALALTAALPDSRCEHPVLLLITQHGPRLRSQVERILDVPQRVRLRFFLPLGLAWARRVSARRGWGRQKVARLSCRVKFECQEALLSCDMEFVFNGTSTAVQFRSLIPLFV